MPYVCEVSPKEIITKKLKTNKQYDFINFEYSHLVLDSLVRLFLYKELLRFRELESKEISS